MTPAQLSRTVVHAVRSAVQAGELTLPADELARWELAAGDGSRPGVVRVPAKAGRGDFSSPIALRLAAASGRTPREVADVLRRRLVREPGIARVDLAGPGFLNITVADAAHAGLVRDVIAQGDAYGRGHGLDGVRLRLRHAPGARAELWAETVERLATACGAEPATRPADAGTDVGGGAVLPCASLSRASGDASYEDALDGDLDSAPGPGSPTELGSPPGPGSGPPLARAHGARERAVDFVVREPGIGAAELVASLGRDGARWALLRAAAHDLPVCDPAVVLAQRESNPLFRVQYAHARVRALLRNGRDLGILPSPETGAEAEPDGVRADGVRSDDVRAVRTGAVRPDTTLLALLADFPRVVEDAARRAAPDRVARELVAVADAFFRFHDGAPPLPCGEEKPSAVHRDRLATAEATGTVLTNGLTLLGISAPVHL
ncbi:ArgS-related anticodon-binding protein NrtL [Streptomyces sp. HSW2009]|uniref:ArgS-related anticodon-binding protein NrtL n=1 Tax=Streptomyces sp. HSW2009 TaxID=3142890 RepID=UPI0032ED0035